MSHFTPYPGYVVGVSDFLMMSLAKLTVAVGKEVKNAVADTEVERGRGRGREGGEGGREGGREGG